MPSPSFIFLGGVALAVYILKRLLQSIVVLFGLSLLIFFIARVVPGDPARAALGHFATEEQIARLRAEMHLDKPFFVQYYYWLVSVVHGDLGKSLYTQRPVIEDLAQFLPATLELMIFATLISLVVGQTLGAFSGYLRNSWFDGIFRVSSYIGVATPPFIIAIFLLFLFSQLLGLAPGVGRLPITAVPPPRITGFLLIDSLIAGRPDLTLVALKHLLLPAFSLAIAHIAQEGRITRASLVDVQQKDYTLAHQVHGIRTSKVLFKYMLRPAIIPTVTVMGMDFAFLLSNAFLVEVVFMWPGFSRYGVTAMLSKDLNAIVAVVLVIGTTVALVNLLVDVTIAILDPTVRIRRRGG